MTTGYTLKGRAKIRKLENKPSFYERTVKRLIQPQNYEVKILTRIMDCIADASKCYKKAAEVSPEKETCDACSISMLCLSEMLDYMLAVIKNEGKIPELEKEIENWEKKLVFYKEVYKGKPKGEAFIQSLEKLMDCIKSLEGYKKFRMRGDERAFEECQKELLEVAGNIEGPLQKIIEDSAKRMDICRLKYMPYSRKITESNQYISKPNIFSRVLKYTIGIIAAIIAGIILLLIEKRYFP